MDINFANMNDLDVTLSSAFRDALSAAPPAEWPNIAMRMGSSSTHNVYPFLGETGSMREWLGPLIAEELESFRYNIPNRKFEKTLKAKRDEIADDQGGMFPLYASRARVHAEACAIHPDELVIGETLQAGATLLCYDGQPFFDSSHPNSDGTTQDNDLGGAEPAWYLFDTSKPIKPLIYQVREALSFASLTDLNSDHVFKNDEFLWRAVIRDAAGFGLWQAAVKSKQTLNEANLKAADEAMTGFTNPEGRNMRMNPTVLMVPRSLKHTALKLMSQEYLASGESNYMRGLYKVIVSNYLDNA